MMYRSFIRKKTTHIYFIILFFIVVVFSLLMYGKNNTIEKYNKINITSNIKVESPSEIVGDMLKIKNVKSVEKCYIYDGLTFLGKKGIKETEIILMNFLKDEYPVNSIFKIETQNISKEFIVKGYDDNVNYLNITSLNNLREKNSKYDYQIFLDNWIYHEKTANKIGEKFNNIRYYIGSSASNKNNYESMLIAFNVFIILNITLFFIILLITIVNIIEDEKKYYKLYWSMGYSKKKIKWITLNKILLLLFVEIILGLIFYSLITLI